MSSSTSGFFVSNSNGVLALISSFFVAVLPVIALMTDDTDPTVMRHKPRDPKVAIFNARTGPRWIFYGLVLGVMSTIPLVWGPDEPSIDDASVGQWREWLGAEDLNLASAIAGPIEGRLTRLLQGPPASRPMPSRATPPQPEPARSRTIP